MILENSNSILLFNPRSGQSKHRIPNSILQIVATVYKNYNTVVVDGNMEKDPYLKINNYIKTGNFRYFGCTVMPGPQLKQAIQFSKKIKNDYPGIIIIWGGYFPSNHQEVTIRSSYVDYVIYGQGDFAFPELIDCLEKEDFGNIEKINNLIFINDKDKLIRTSSQSLSDIDGLNALPYRFFSTFYPVEKYILKTFMGNRTFSYHSSFGCPYKCSFCGVINLYGSTWKAKSANLMFEEIMQLKMDYQIDAIEFHDNNFFASPKRVIEFCRLMKNKNIRWWSEGRIDTIMNFTDDELLLMKEAGCCMIFMGAESSDDSILKKINKGGKLKGSDTKNLALRLAKFDIIPEYSFVLGFPANENQNEIRNIRSEINNIRAIKRINPKTEIVIYIYSPVPVSESEMKGLLAANDFNFPSTLEQWLDPKWESFNLRKNPHTPWIRPALVRKIKNFETVINATFPSVSDFKIYGWKRIILQTFGKLRYISKFYYQPVELSLLLKIFGYRQPEKEGFYSK
jgi:anaerobic magnesium-protoporphyrin IX monomethyl ester cyclase